MYILTHVDKHWTTERLKLTKIVFQCSPFCISEYIGLVLPKKKKKIRCNRQLPVCYFLYKRERYPPKEIPGHFSEAVGNFPERALFCTTTL